MSKIHIIGAGLAGLSAAVEATKYGYYPVIYEMTEHAGGRCRSYYDEKIGAEIDNGNHLVLGSNAFALQHINQIGSMDAFYAPTEPRYHFIDLENNHNFSYLFPGIVPGTSTADIFRLLRLLLAGESRRVAEYFSHRSTLLQRCIEPLTLAALNTHPAEASASMLKSILLKILTGGKKAGNYYLAKSNLSQAIINPALRYIEANDGDIHYNSSLKTFDNNGLRVTALRFAKGTVSVQKNENVVLALPPHTIQRLLPETKAPTSFNPIVNAHFSFDLPLDEYPTPSFVGVIGSPVQWIFFKQGLISTTTSAANYITELKGLTQDKVAQIIWKHVCKVLKIDHPLPPHRIITEKRATFAATPANLHMRPKTTDTPYPNLLLAGDWTDTGLPATIESAVKSGCCAIKALMRQ